MAHNPKVSIIMPTRNRPHLIKDALRSVLNQTMRNFELIIIDDSPQDNTKREVLRFKDSRIQYMRRNSKMGIASARNMGLLQARARYISYLDDDDIYYPNHLKTLSSFLDNHPEFGLVYGKVHFKIKDRIFLPYRFDYSKERLELEDCIPTISLMHRIICINKSGFFDKNLSGVMEDWDMWLRISDSFQVCHLPTFVAQARFHKDNATKGADYSKPYIQIIKKRLSLKKRCIPFIGYLMGITYRLIYKFKTKKHLCIRFLQVLRKADKQNPEINMSLSAGYLSYGCVDKAIKAGVFSISTLPRHGQMNAWQKIYAFNAHRLLAYAFKRKGNSWKMPLELNNTLGIIFRKTADNNRFIDLTGITSKFLNRFSESSQICIKRQI